MLVRSKKGRDRVKEKVCVRFQIFGGKIQKMPPRACPVPQTHARAQQHLCSKKLEIDRADLLSTTMTDYYNTSNNKEL